MAARNFRHGNLAHVSRNLGNRRSHKEPVLAMVHDVFQNPQTGYYQVNCDDVRRGQPYSGVPVMGFDVPVPKSMGLIFFADGSVDLPFFIPLGW